MQARLCFFGCPTLPSLPSQVDEPPSVDAEADQLLTSGPLLDFQRRFQEAAAVQESRGGLIQSAQHPPAATHTRAQPQHDRGPEQADSETPQLPLFPAGQEGWSSCLPSPMTSPRAPEAKPEGSSADSAGDLPREGPVHMGPVHSAPGDTGDAHVGTRNGTGNADLGAKGVLGAMPAAQGSGGRGYSGRGGRGRGGRLNPQGRARGPGLNAGERQNHSQGHSHSHSHSHTQNFSQGHNQGHSPSSGRGHHSGRGQQAAGRQQGQRQGPSRGRHQHPVRQSKQCKQCKYFKQYQQYQQY